MSIEALEDAIRRGWDRDAIEVYADHLQRTGDPRGELVSIDLAIDQGSTPELVARRRELIAEWFGDEVPAGAVRYGFVEIDASGMGPGSQLAAALKGPGGAYIRSVTLAGARDELQPALRAIAGEQRPWLTSLTIRMWNEDPRAPLFDVKATTELFAAMPHLTSLVLEGRSILGGAVHSNVESMTLTGYDALPIAAVWPKLRSIDFAFHCQYEKEHADPAVSFIANVLQPRFVPSLEHLDFSRNEPGTTEPRSLGGEVFMSAFFARYAKHPRLASVVLPSLHNNTAAIESVEATLTSLPALRDVKIYAPNARLPTHPTAAISEIAIKSGQTGPLQLG